MKRSWNIYLLLGLALVSCLLIFVFTSLPHQNASCVIPSESLAAEPISENSTFAVHYIDVGQADASLVLCDGKVMLIDGGNADDSSLIYSYLKKLNITFLDYIVATHPHEDHVGGLSGALHYATAGQVLSPVLTYSGTSFDAFLKVINAQGIPLTVPAPEDTFTLGSAQIEVLGPTGAAADVNNQSIVLRVTYGETSFLFMGDAEREAEQCLLNAGYDLSSTVLKVGHHGAADATGYPFLWEVRPEYAVISVGVDNDYGHPSDAVLSKLRDAEAEVLRTDLHGDIIMLSNGESISILAGKGANTLVPEDTSYSSVCDDILPADFGILILNTNSKKYHQPDCRSVDKIRTGNRQEYTGTIDVLLDAGFSPCGNCHTKSE